MNRIAACALLAVTACGSQAFAQASGTGTGPSPSATEDAEVQYSTALKKIEGFCSFSALVAPRANRSRIIADNQTCVLSTDENGTSNRIDIYLFDGEENDLSYAFVLVSEAEPLPGRNREWNLYWNSLPGNPSIDDLIGFVGGDDFNPHDGACWYTKIASICMRLRSGRDVRRLIPRFKPAGE